MPTPINIFIIYAREDREIKLRLLTFLNPLKDAFNLNIWHDDYIQPGQEWKPHIESRLEQTDLFLLLVSADFMDSAFIHQVEFKFAIDRHKQNKSIVIPVIINYCLWDIDIRYDDYTFNLNQLQVLPDEGKPIGEWRTPDQAYYNIAGGIRKVLLTIINKQQQEIDEQKRKLKRDERKIQEDIRQKDDPVKRERDEALRNEILQKQISEQKEKENDIHVVKNYPPEPIVSKKIIYSLLALCATIILGYFIFHKKDEPSSDSNKVSHTQGSNVDSTSFVVPSHLQKKDPQPISDQKVHPSKETNTNADVFRIVGISPAPHTTFSSNQSFEINLRIHYNLQSVEQAIYLTPLVLYVKGQFASGQSIGRGIPDQVTIYRGQGDLSIKIIYPGNFYAKFSKSQLKGQFAVAPNGVLWRGIDKDGKVIPLNNELWNCDDYSYNFNIVNP
jgi:hypothetical protein